MSEQIWFSKTRTYHGSLVGTCHSDQALAEGSLFHSGKMGMASLFKSQGREKLNGKEAAGFETHSFTDGMVACFD